MKNDESRLREALAALKRELPDDGFSERVAGMLPRRSSLLPQIIEGLCSFAGLTIALCLIDTASLTEKMLAATTALSEQAIVPAQALERMGPLSLTATVAVCLGAAAFAWLVDAAARRAVDV